MLLFIVVGACAQEDSPQNPPASSRDRILISVSDKKGNAVSIGKGSLTLTVDKRSVEILDLMPAGGVPLDFFVLADLSGSNRDKMEFEKEAIRLLFQALSGGSNRGYLGGFNDNVSLITRPLLPADLEPLLERMAPRGGTALFAAIAQGCGQLAKSQDTEPRRRIIFVISDGDDNASRGARVEDAVHRAQRAGVSVFALQLAFPYPSHRGEQTLKAMATQTGGKMTKLERKAIVIEGLLRPLHTQYFVEFVPPSSLRGAVLTLELKARDRSVQIAAPTEYIHP